MFRGDAPKLIWVHLGGAGGTGTTSATTIGQFIIMSIKGDYLVCRTLSDAAAGAVDIPVAKQWMLRRSPFDGTTKFGYSYTYTDGDADFKGGTKRTKTRGADEEKQIVTPPSYPDSIIYAVKNITGGTGVVTDDSPPVVVEWQELSDGRAWAQEPPEESVNR